jgi:hypothetical protein
MNVLSAFTIIQFPPDSVRFSHIILDFQLLKIIVSRIVSTESEFGGFFAMLLLLYISNRSFIRRPSGIRAPGLLVGRAGGG